MNKRKLMYILIISGVILLGLGGTMTYLMASATNTTTVVGTTASASLGLTVAKVSTNATGGLIPMSDSDLQLGVTGTSNKQCMDKNGNTVCQIYKITLTNTSTSSVTVDGEMKLTATNMADLKWSRLTNQNTIASPAMYNSKNITTMVNNDNYTVGQTKYYYVVVWISENGVDQNTTNTGTFTGSITFITSIGEGISATFSSFNDTVRNLVGQASGDGGVYAVAHNEVSAVTSATGRKIPATIDYRYYGANPNNYIWFNCSPTDQNSKAYGTNDYSYNTTNCELWRIIGSFRVETPVYGSDGKTVTGYITENRVKIIRNDSIGNYSWDNKISRENSTKYYGQNDWTNARLMKTLNPGYETNNEDTDTTYENNSLYWNRGSGTCYSGITSGYVSLTEVTCNFTSTGLKDLSKDLLEPVRYYLGGQNAISYTDYYYNRQVSNNKWSGNTSTYWNGYVGLMYTDDYGYAAGQIEAIDSQTRRKSYINNTGVGEYSGIKNKIWLYTGYLQQVITTPSTSSAYASFIGYNGNYYYMAFNYYSSTVMSVRPVVYLKNDVQYYRGVGTASSPYVVVS